MKLQGAGPGPQGLLWEWIGLNIADAFGVNVPSPSILFLPHGFPWQAGTDEFDATLQRSFGWNIGTRFIPNAETLTSDELNDLAPNVVQPILLADHFLQNVDRTANNPNLLRDDNGKVVAIDFDTCMFGPRALSELSHHTLSIPHHVFAERRLESRPLPDIDWDQLLGPVPESWVDATEVSRGVLKTRLERRATIMFKALNAAMG